MPVYSRPFLILLAFELYGTHAVPISNVDVTQLPSNNTSEPLMQGWTASPNGRGTIDIIWSCAITMFLCSWSVLCLQVPSEKDSRFDILWRRLWLTFLCALGPEFTLQLALGQWSSARQSVRDFHDSGFPEWTMKHAFYADSGGFQLCTPDFKPIPIDAKQLLHLIKHEYIEYPEHTERDIEDKNKVDLLLRLITTGQIIWFSATVIARGAQGLVITGMELTTAAFIFCSFGTTFCWWYKGADVAVPAELSTQTTMVKILTDAEDAAAAPYHRTPLDFISREEWHWSLYWTHWINILRKMHIVFAPRALPHDRLENTIWLNFTSSRSMPAFILMCISYSAIFVTAWNDRFPTYAEQITWRISSLSLLAAVLLYFIVTAFAYAVYPAIQRYFHPKPTPSPESPRIDVSPQVSSQYDEKAAPNTQVPTVSSKRPKTSKISSIASSLRNNSVLKDPSLDVPLKATLPIYVVAFFYCSSRTLIFILDIIQLRSLPSSAYATVNWGGFVPHLS